MIAELVARACAWIASRRQCRPITREDGAPYLDRYYLFGNEPKYFPEVVRVLLGWLPFTVFLHHFRDSDRDEELHSHPWAKSVSLVLTGGYVEERREGGEEYVDDDLFAHRRPYRVAERDVKPWSLNRIASTDFHRVLLKEKDAWTIFVTGRKAATWYFWSPRTNETIPWRQHIERRKALAMANAPGGDA